MKKYYNRTNSHIVDVRSLKRHIYAIKAYMNDESVEMLSDTLYVCQLSSKTPQRQKLNTHTNSKSNAIYNW